MVSLLVIALYFIVQSHSKSFKASSDSLTYADAQSWCENQGMTLASILTEDERDQAHSVCRAKTSASGCWVGLQDPNYKGDWVWDDGSAPGYAFNGASDSPSTGQKPWDGGEPASSSRKLCVRMREGSSGYWTIFNCNNDQSALCSSDGTTPTTTTTKSPTVKATTPTKNPTTKAPTTKAPTIKAVTPTKKPTEKPTSASSSNNDGERVYKGYSSASSWSDAKAKCEDDGLTLAIIESDDELEAAQTACTSTSNSKGCWIGATQESGSWEWVNGDSVSYDHWASGHPKSGSCARMRTGVGLSSGWWVSYSSSNELAFVCSGGSGSGSSGSSSKTTKSPTSASKTTEEPTKSSGSSGSSGYNGYIYNSDKAWTWWAGMEWCSKQGTSLATISSDEENEEAFRMCKLARENKGKNVGNFFGCWIGLTDSTKGYEGNGYEKSDAANAQEGTFRWDDGSKVDYAFHSDGTPLGAHLKPKRPHHPWNGKYRGGSFDEPRQYWYPSINAPVKDYVGIRSRGDTAYWMCLDGGKDDSTGNPGYILCNKPKNYKMEVTGEEGEGSTMITVLLVLVAVFVVIAIALCVWCKCGAKGEAKQRVREEDEVSDDEGLALPMGGTTV